MNKSCNKHLLQYTAFVGVFSKQLRLILFVVFLVSLFLTSFGQYGDPFRKYQTPDRLIQKGYYSIYNKSDSVYIVAGLCKNYTVFIPRDSIAYANLLEEKKIISNKPKLLTVHGNIQYDFYYRSFIDTPYLQHNLKQHTIQTNLNFLYKEKYPFQLRLSSRQSNSPFFRNYFDPNLQFDKYNFNRKIKEDLLERIVQNNLQIPLIKRLEDDLKELEQNAVTLKQWLRNPDLLQRIVEEREQLLRDSLGRLSSKNIDGLNMRPNSLKMTRGKRRFDEKYDQASSNIDSSSVFKTIETKKLQLDSVENRIASLKQKADSIKRNFSDDLSKLKNKINQARNHRDLKKIAAQNGVNEKQRKNFEDVLCDFQKIGIGRSLLSYTELTAWDINLTGINLEYNPGNMYAAIAGGRVDYGFRDFIGKQARTQGQNLIAGRIGFNIDDKRSLILTVYNGKKYNYGRSLADTVRNYIPLAGYSLEASIKKNANTSLSFEIAKSTKPVTGIFSENKELSSLIEFSSKSNMAVNIKGEYLLEGTQTQLSGFFRKMGQHFQSFSLFTYSADQESWHAKAWQPLWQNRADIALMLRKNDFTNPFIDKTFKTSTVFKSVQANLRIPKWPQLSAGYYPGTQIYVVDNQKLRENVYYILNGSAVYFYKAGGINLSSSFFYNRYFNQNTDSGFVAYKGVNYLFAQNFISRLLQLQLGYNYTDQQELKFYTLESVLNYSPTQAISMGAGVKYNKVRTGAVYWGGSLKGMVNIKGLGMLQLQYEKSFFPTVHQSLYPIEIGRLSWFKTF